MEDKQWHLEYNPKHAAKGSFPWHIEAKDRHPVSGADGLGWVEVLCDTKENVLKVWGELAEEIGKTGIDPLSHEK